MIKIANRQVKRNGTAKRIFFFHQEYDRYIRYLCVISYFPLYLQSVLRITHPDLTEAGSNSRPPNKRLLPYTFRSMRIYLRRNGRFSMDERPDRVKGETRSVAWQSRVNNEE